MPKLKKSGVVTVTRIAMIGGSRKLTLNKNKAKQLDAIASELGKLRCDLWNEYGSLKAWGIHKYELDKVTRPNRSRYNLTGKLWEATAYDVFDDIHLVQAACIEKVLKKFGKRYSTHKAKKSFLQTTLESREWMSHPAVMRVVRKFWKRGRTRVNNQIVVKEYDCFEDDNGVIWLRIPMVDRKKPLKIPTTLPFPVKCQLRLIKTGNKWRIHYTTDIEKAKPKTKGNVIACDRGYSEVYVTSSNDGGRFLGQNFGAVQSAETDRRVAKLTKRHKIRSIANKARKSGNHTKADRIERNNLGLRKWDSQINKFQGQIKTIVFTATVSLMANATKVAYENLTDVIQSKKRRRKSTKARLNSWCKGVVADALKQVSHRVGCAVVDVNAAYTSQLDSRYGVLLGERNGDKFTGFDGVVLQADINAADNVLARMSDSEITRFMRFTDVKKILLERTSKFQESEAQTGKDKPKTLDTTCSQSESELKTMINAA